DPGRGEEALRGPQRVDANPATGLGDQRERVGAQAAGRVVAGVVPGPVEQLDRDLDLHQVRPGATAGPGRGGRRDVAGGRGRCELSRWRRGDLPGWWGSDGGCRGWRGWRGGGRRRL